MNRRQRRAAAREAIGRRLPDGSRANGTEIREARRQFSASLVGFEPAEESAPKHGPTRLWTPPR